MPPAEAFKRLLGQRVAPLFKASRFKKTGTTFHLHESAGNWGVANFQKSPTNTSERVMFRLNLGIYSPRIARGLGGEPIDRPAMWDCQCQLPFSLLTDGPDDLWWSIDADTDLDALGAALGQYVTELAVPWIQQHISDEDLRETWRNDAFGCTGAARVRYMEILLREIGPGDLPMPELPKAEDEAAAAAAEMDALLRLVGAEPIPGRANEWRMPWAGDSDDQGSRHLR